MNHNEIELREHIEDILFNTMNYYIGMGLSVMESLAF